MFGLNSVEIGNEFIFSIYYCCDSVQATNKSNPLLRRDLTVIFASVRRIPLFSVATSTSHLSAGGT